GTGQQGFMQSQQGVLSCHGCHLSKCVVIAGRSYGNPLPGTQTARHPASDPFRSSLLADLIDWVADYQGSMSEHYTCQGYLRFQIFSDLTQVPCQEPFRAQNGIGWPVSTSRPGSLLTMSLPEMAHFPTTLFAVSLGRRPKYI